MSKRTELARITIRTTDIGIALANLPGNSATPFVTWRIDEDGNTYLGHYFSTFDEALKDFLYRTEEQLKLAYK